MKIVAIVQARMGSTRLPGKVMKTLAGRTVLDWVIARVAACPLVAKVVVATTVEPIDDVVVAEAERCEAEVFRGSEKDVLGRYFGAAQAAGADVVIRVTSDCPMFDPVLLNKMIEEYLGVPPQIRERVYLSNTSERNFPRGLDAEIFSFLALARAHQMASKDYEREHVTPYLYQHPEEFVIMSHLGERDLSAMRWTLDTPEDFEFCQAVYGELQKGDEPFATAALLELLQRRPELGQINAHVEQKTLH